MKYPPLPLIQRPVRSFGPPPEPAEKIRPRYTQAQADTARATAVAKRGVVATQYNSDNIVCSGDLSRYTADLADWNRVKAAMMAQNMTDYTNCYNYLLTANTKGNSEATHLTDAYNAIGAGDADMTAGDGSTDPNVETPDYMAASTQYDSAASKCGLAEADHTPCAAALTSAEAILVQYG